MKTENLYSNMAFGGHFQWEHRRDGKVIAAWDDHNLAPTLGLNHILDVVLNGATAISPWYIGLYSNSYTPQTDDAYSHIGSRFTEITDYSETTRREYTAAAAVGGVVTNDAARGVFTFTQNITVNGGFFVSNSTKGDNAAAGAIMLAASLHSPSRSMIIGDELLVRYVYTATSA